MCAYGSIAKGKGKREKGWWKKRTLFGLMTPGEDLWKENRYHDLGFAVVYSFLSYEIPVYTESEGAMPHILNTDLYYILCHRFIAQFPCLLLLLRWLIGSTLISLPCMWGLCERISLSFLPRRDDGTTVDPQLPKPPRRPSPFYGIFPCISISVPVPSLYVSVLLSRRSLPYPPSPSPSPSPP